MRANPKHQQRSAAPLDTNIVKQLQGFAAQKENDKLEFPSSLSSEERKQIHLVSKDYGLVSASIGEGDNRRIVVTKPQKITSLSKEQLSPKLNQWFAKHFGLPMTSYEPAPFLHMFAVCDEYFSLTPKMNAFLSAIIEAGGEAAFISQSTNLEKVMIDKLQTSEAFRKFDQADIRTHYKYKVVDYPLSNKSFYRAANVGGFYLSIDISSANFNALKYHDKELVLGCDTFPDLVTQWTKLEIFRTSKPFRQKVLGYLSASKQLAITKWMMCSVGRVLLSAGVFTPRDVVCRIADEIIFRCQSEKEARSRMAQADQVLKEQLTQMRPILKLEVFQLSGWNVAFEGSHWKPQQFFARDYLNGEFVLKCIAPELFPFALRLVAPAISSRRSASSAILSKFPPANLELERQYFDVQHKVMAMVPPLKITELIASKEADEDE